MKRIKLSDKMIEIKMEKGECIMNEQDKREMARARLIKALEQFKSAAAEIDHQWDPGIDDENEILCEGYPFDKSFTELTYEIEAWVDSSVEKLESL